MNPYVVKVCVGFAVGALFAALGIIPMARYSRLWPDFATWGAVIGLFSVSGAIGGASLRRGWRPVIGFSLAFGALGVAMPTPMQDVFRGAIAGVSRASGCTTLESMFPVFFIVMLTIELSIFGAIAFGLAGVIGAAISGLGWRLAFAAAGAFGAAGAIGGPVYVFVIDTHIPKFLVFLVPLLVIYSLGGVLFAVASEREECNKRKKLGLCLKCGYDLRASIERCPECGEPIASILSQSDA